MNTAITTKRDIGTVTAEIRTLVGQARQIQLCYAVEIGRRLTEAKSILQHGEWGRWLEEEVEFSQRKANMLMQLFDEYGAAQIGLMGAEANSQTFANLPYTKALALLSISEEDRETFAEEHNVEGMSVRELQEAVRKAEEEKARADTLAEELAQTKEAAFGLQEEAKAIAAELSELRSRPVDVAVREPSDAEVAAAVAEKTAKLEKELAVINTKLAKAEDAKKKAEEKAKKAGEKESEAVKAAIAKREAELADQSRETLTAAATAKKEAEQLRTERDELQRRLLTAGGEMAVFKLRFEAVQVDWQALTAAFADLPEEQQAKCRQAMRAALAGFEKTVEEA